MRRFLGNALAGIALASFTLAPLSALAQGRGHGNGRGNGHGYGQGQGEGDNWNPAPPKKNGRHDNRNWNKHRGNDDDYYRYGTTNPYYNGTRQYYPDYNRTRSYSGYVPDQYARRQQTKNEWRNLAIAAGAVSILGLLKKDSTLTFAGAAGGLYSLYRYEQDRKSQSSLARARAYYFSQPYFYRDGSRYDRRLVTQDGQRYYQFVRHH